MPQTLRIDSDIDEPPGTTSIEKALMHLRVKQLLPKKISVQLSDVLFTQN